MRRLRCRAPGVRARRDHDRNDFVLTWASMLGLVTVPRERDYIHSAKCGRCGAALTVRKPDGTLISGPEGAT